MAHPLVLGVFDSLNSAAHAARAVHALGIGRHELSVVARSHQEAGELARALDATPGAEIEDSRPFALLGELGAYLVAAVAVGVPGLGQVVTAGPLSAELGEAAGHAGGGLPGVLRQAGIGEGQAATWAERVKNGAILLAVHATPSNAEAVLGAFEQSEAVAMAVAQWQQ
jgi:hypothetical protein